MTRPSATIDFIHEFQQQFDGAPWYGRSVVDTLEQLEPDVVFRRTATGHSICQFVDHMSVWVEVATRRLLGEPSEPSPEQDWASDEPKDRARWEAAKLRIRDAHEAIVEALQERPDLDLSLPAAGKAYTNRTLLHGVLQHTTYHLGQIALAAVQEP